MDANWRPRVRGEVMAFEGEYLVRFVDLGSLEVKDFAIAEWGPRLIRMLTGENSVGSIVAAMRSDASEGDIIQCIQVLADERLLSHPRAAEPSEGLHSRQIAYFDEMVSRQSELAATSGEEMHARVRRSCVLVVGCGGMGTHVLDALVRAGVGAIEIFDPDSVEASNLHRQILYAHADVGRPKTDAAAQRLEEISPDTIVRARRERFERASTPRSDRIDLVVNCADEPDVLEMSDTVADWSMGRGIPHIVGGAYGANLGMLPVSVVPGRSVCWSCIRAATETLSPGAGMTAIKGRARTTGTLGPITGLISNYVALDALRILAGLAPILVNAVRELDLAGFGWRTLDIEPQQACAVCAGVG